MKQHSSQWKQKTREREIQAKRKDSHERYLSLIEEKKLMKAATNDNFRSKDVNHNKIYKGLVWWNPEWIETKRWI